MKQNTFNTDVFSKYGFNLSVDDKIYLLYYYDLIHNNDNFIYNLINDFINFKIKINKIAKEYNVSFSEQEKIYLINFFEQNNISMNDISLYIIIYKFSKLV